jgi:rare lipoprotein A
MNKLTLAALVVIGCSYVFNFVGVVEAAPRHAKKSHVISHQKENKVITASWYGAAFHGKRTANGEKFNMYEMTAAHKSLPLSSYVEVTNLKNHRSIVVRINDRGPFHSSRSMDLSLAAAKELGMKGTTPIEITPVAQNQIPAQLTRSKG